MLLMSCASSIPVRQCQTKLWLLEKKHGCVTQKSEDKIIKICPDDPQYPFLIGISPEDYACERAYQDELKSKL